MPDSYFCCKCYGEHVCEVLGPSDNSYIVGISYLSSKRPHMNKKLFLCRVYGYGTPNNLLDITVSTQKLVLKFLIPKVMNPSIQFP